MHQTGVMTRKGQVTIPAEMRRALDMEEGDRVTFELVEDEVRIRRIGSVAERTAGILKGKEPPPSAEELREIAEWVIAQDVIERSGT
jgi:uncharacterized protein